MAKNLEISILLDYYGQMLTEKQLEVAQLYYNEDLFAGGDCTACQHHPTGRARQHQARRRHPAGDGAAAGTIARKLRREYQEKLEQIHLLCAGDRL